MIISYIWTLWKTALAASNALPRMSQERDSYRIWFVDGADDHETRIWYAEVPYPICATYLQTQNDADRADFEGSVLPVCNKPQVRSPDGLTRVVAEKGSSSRVTLYSPNWCDKTTWYSQSTRVVAEQPGVVGGAHQLASFPVVDAGHGKITQEDSLKDAGGFTYRVCVTYLGAAKIEQDPHVGSGGDYTLNYTTGVLTPLTWTASATDTAVTYHAVGSSLFTIKPTAGKKLSLELAECQFSTDLILTDTVVFQPKGFASVFAPQLNLAPGTLIPLGAPFKYKTLWDYYNDSVKAYPVYPAIGGGGWRGCQVPVTVFDWDYVRSTEILSSKGMEIDIVLEHETPFGGTCATVSFYCANSNE